MWWNYLLITNFNDCVVKFCGCISNYITHFVMKIIRARTQVNACSKCISPCATIVISHNALSNDHHQNATKVSETGVDVWRSYIWSSFRVYYIVWEIKYCLYCRDGLHTVNRMLLFISRVENYFDLVSHFHGIGIIPVLFSCTSVTMHWWSFYICDTWIPINQQRVFLCMRHVAIDFFQCELKQNAIWTTELFLLYLLNWEFKGIVKHWTSFHLIESWIMQFITHTHAHKHTYIISRCS